MRIYLLGAATAALAAAGCTGERDYPEDTTTTTDVAEIETVPATTDTASDPYATPRTTPSTTADSTSATGAGTTTSTAPLGQQGDSMAQSGSTETTTPTLGSLQTASASTIAISEISSQSDAERIPEEAFRRADVNGDGELSREEYMTLAMGARSYAGSGGATTSVLSQGEIDDTTTGATTTAAVDPIAIDSAFQEASGGQQTLTMDQFRESMVQRFQTADADGDNELSEEERETFAGLIIGQEHSVQ